MPFSQASFTADGISRIVNVPFPYLDKADVSVTLNGSVVSPATYTWLTTSSIQLASAPAAGVIEVVKRSSPVGAPVVVFEAGSLNHRDLNELATWLLYVTQEAFDLGAVTAATLANITSTVNAAMAAAAASAAAAATSQSSAAASATSATGAANSASTSAGVASGAATSASGSQTSATASASSATASAASAAGSASSATTSASGAATSATSAAGSATSAAASAAALQGQPSASTLTIGLGAKTFVIGAGLPFAAGEYVLIPSGSDPTGTWMHGQITSYLAGSLNVNVTTVSGSGSHGDWTVYLSGPRGPNGTGSGDMLSTNNLSDVANPATARSNLGLVLGTNPNNVVQLDGSSRLPAVDGSALTLIPMRGYIDGLKVSPSTTTFTVDPGIAEASDHSQMMALAAIISKSTSAWASGNGAGGLDTGAIAANQWYYVYLMRRPDTGLVEPSFSLSASAPTIGGAIPAAFTKVRRIGVLKTNGSSQFVPIIQQGDKSLLATPLQEWISLNPGTAAVTRTLANVPPGIKVDALLSVLLIQDTGASSAYISSLDVPDVAPGLNGAFSMALDAGVSVADSLSLVGTPITVGTNTSGQIRTRLDQSTGTTSFRGTALGWIDKRGRDA